MPHPLHAGAWDNPAGTCAACKEAELRSWGKDNEADNPWADNTSPAAADACACDEEAEERKEDTGIEGAGNPSFPVGVASSAASCDDAGAGTSSGDPYRVSEVP